MSNIQLPVNISYQYNIDGNRAAKDLFRAYY